MKTQANYFCSLLLTTFLLLTLECSAQSTSKKELYYKDFNWTITIPENFEKVAPEVREKMEERGVSAIEDTYGGKVENKAKSIFIFSSGQTNYFESNYQPFDPKVDGDYLESCKKVNELSMRHLMHRCLRKQK